MEALEKYGPKHIYSSKVLFYNEPGTLNTIGGVITPMGSGLDINFGKKDVSKYNKVRFVASPSGCSMLLKKSLFLEMGGFDKDYFAYLEDVDFGWRCWLKGIKHIMSQNLLYTTNMEVLGVRWTLLLEFSTFKRTVYLIC